MLIVAAVWTECAQCASLMQARDELQSHPNYVLRTIGSGVFIGPSTLSEPKKNINAGSGVFASKDSPKITTGDFVVGYQGLLITKSELAVRQREGMYNRESDVTDALPLHGVWLTH
jgi:hypothetical protein